MRIAEKKIRLKNSYDRIAALYNGFFSLPLAQKVEQDEIETISGMADVKGKAVLDIGCGYGKFFKRWQSDGAGLVVGIDFSKKMLKLAAQKNGDAIAVLGDGFKLPFKDKSFDVSTCIGLALYYENMNPLLAEMARVTRESCILSFPPRSLYGPAYFISRGVGIKDKKIAGLQNILSNYFKDTTTHICSYGLTLICRGSLIESPHNKTPRCKPGEEISRKPAAISLLKAAALMIFTTLGIIEGVEHLL